MMEARWNSVYKFLIAPFVLHFFALFSSLFSCAFGIIIFETKCVCCFGGQNTHVSFVDKQHKNPMSGPSGIANTWTHLHGLFSPQISPQGKYQIFYFQKKTNTGDPKVVYFSPSLFHSCHGLFGQVPNLSTCECRRWNRAILLHFIAGNRPCHYPPHVWHK